MLSSIQWLRPPKADLSGPRDGYTWNPIRGCSKISRGCTYCYAESLSKRNPAILGQWGPDAPRSFGARENLLEPLRWQKQAAKAMERRLVFLGSLMDIGEERQDLSGMQDFALGAMIPATPNLDYVLTTKRPEGLLWNCERAWGHEWPRNAWPLITTEGARELTERTPAILDLARRAPVIGLSLEPLLDDPVHPLCQLYDAFLGLPNPPELWLIWGGESGAHSRPFDCEWIRKGMWVARCANHNNLRWRTFVKQLGEAGYDESNGIGGPKVKQPDLISPICRWTDEGGDPAEWPADLRVREWPGSYPAETAQ